MFRRILSFSAVVRGVLAFMPVAMCLAAPEAQGHDLPHIGTGKYSDGPRAGYLYSCQTQFNPGAPGAIDDPPWIKGHEYNPHSKPTIEGKVMWPNAQISVTREGDVRVVRANNLPTHPTGKFPVEPSDYAYRFDRNPNVIREQDILLRLPADPEIAAQPSCVPMGMIGFTLVGGALYNALDARGRDAPAYEIMDRCGGHPQRNGQYHYHDHAPCLPDGKDASGHSELIGFALDGFGIYGPMEAGGRELTNANLDGCHGHIGPVVWDGEERTMYHYHMNGEYPYSIGCFRGTPVSVPRLANAGPRSGDDRMAVGQPPQRRRNDPITAIAAELGVDADALREAVGPPPPDLRRAAKQFGISEQTLREAFKRHRPR